MDRLFFVITKKQLCVEGAMDELEIRHKVSDCLRRAAITSRRVYFIDSHVASDNPDEPEWKTFIEELKAYVNKNRTRLLREQAAKKIRRPLELLRDEFNGHIRDLLGDSQSRDRKIKQLEKKLKVINDIRVEFADEVESARARLSRGSSQTFGDEVDEIVKELKEGDWSAYFTSTKDEQVKKMRDLVEPLKDWPERLTKNLARASESLASFLQRELSTRAAEPPQSINRKDLPPEYRAFGVTAINEKVSEDQYRYITSYTGWLKDKAASVKTLVEDARSTSMKSIGGKFDEMAGYYENQISAVMSKVQTELKNLRDETNTEAAINDKRAHLSFIEDCLKEFAAIK